MASFAPGVHHGSHLWIRRARSAGQHPLLLRIGPDRMQHGPQIQHGTCYDSELFHDSTHRIHGAGIYANMTGVY